MSSWLLILGMGAVTFATRYGLFAWPELRFPPGVRRALHYVPTAVLTAIIVPGMLLPDGTHWALRWDNAYLIAGLATLALAAFRRPLLVSIGGGLALFFLLRWALGQLPL